MYFTTSSGRIELSITKRQAINAYHSGSCDHEVMALSKEPNIRRQLVKLAPALVASELAEYGAWDSVELADHAQNLQRLLWIACGDIVEELA